MTKSKINGEDLHRAVDGLIQGERLKITREDKSTEWKSVPSLWSQLEGSVAYSGNGGSAVAKSKPPITTGVVALMIEITAAAGEGAIDMTGHRQPETPNNLRAVAATLVGRADDDLLTWWTENVRRWVREARAILRLDPERPRWARGSKCPDCGEVTAAAHVNGEAVRTPALAVIWTPPEGNKEDHHKDTDWHVRAIECRSCDAVWWRGADLDQLVADMMRANVSRETMAG